MSELAHLQGLNEEQRNAVTTIEGPLLILAGAGSGKTRVLTRRIAHMVHSGIEPHNLLAVTFTKKAATEMRGRVVDLVGENTLKIWVATFHSTCARILRKDIENLGYTRRFAIYDDDDQRRVVRQALEDLGIDKKQSPARKILQRIDFYKNRMMSIEEVIEQRRAHANDPTVKVWRSYEEALLASNAVDFNDLIGLTVRLFKEHPHVLHKWQERFQFVMVDEYQDTNQAQYMLLQLLSAEHRNIGVVGDDDQSIYGFRGADVSNILGFQKDYPEALVVRLEQNYRSTKPILDVAHAVVQHNTGRLDKKLWTNVLEGPRVRLVELPNPHAEGDWIAKAILKLKTMGFIGSDIAIIYRTNAMSRPLEAAFRRMNIAHRVVGGRKFFERREVRDALAYIRLVVNPSDDAAFLRVVNVPTRGIGAKTLASLRAHASEQGRPLLEAARSYSSSSSRATSGLASFCEVIDEVGDVARQQGPSSIIENVVHLSGYQTMLERDVDSTGNTSPDAKKRLANLVLLATETYATAQEFSDTDLSPIEKLITWLDRVSLSSDKEDSPDDSEVTLLTVHTSKGLEFPVVFVVQLNEGSFPHSRSIEEGISEERRLAYVAFTRAMKRLLITRSAVGLAHRNTTEPTPCSRFLYGLPPEATNGDLPYGEPAEQGSVIPSLDAPQREALRQMVAWRKASPAASPEGEHTLVDVESSEDLSPGTKVFHNSLGKGTVLTLSDAHIRIMFEQGGSRRLSLQQLPVKLLLD